MSGTILVTGAAGFLGSALADTLDAKGRSVRRAVREGQGASVVAMGDIGPQTDWSAAVYGVDTIVHCAARAHVVQEELADPLPLFRALNRDATLALARAGAASGVRRFVFVSSIGVHGGATFGTPFSADDVPCPHSPYAISKWEAEQGLAIVAAETGMEVVIVRPPLVIGPGAKGNLGTIARLIGRGFPIPFGAVTRNRRDLVSLPVLVDLLIQCVDHPSAAGRVFLASDNRTRSTADIVRAVAVSEYRSARLMPVPARLISAGLRLIGRKATAEQLLGDLEVDIAQTRDTLGWQPDVTRIF